tara:strand:- start:1019 stop:2245 length:1227 start_codon:yes stop_codon:yes gene_type:complete
MESSITTDSSDYSKPSPPSSEEKSPSVEKTLPELGEIPIENKKTDFEIKTPSGSPPKEGMLYDPETKTYIEAPGTPSYSPPEDSSEPKTPDGSPPELSPSDWHTTVQEVDKNTGYIKVRPRFDKPEHGDIQYYYQNLSDNNRKVLAALSNEEQAKVLKYVVNEIKTKYPETNEGYIVDHLNYLKDVDMVNEILKFKENPQPYNDLYYQEEEKEEEENEDPDLELKNSAIDKLKSALDKKNKKKQNIDLYSDVLDTVKIVLRFKEINKNLKNNIEKKLKDKFEKKCNTNGYVRTNSLRVVNHSSGILRGDSVEFTIVIQYKVCYPVEGMIVRAKVKNVTKAGIRAEISEKEEPTPLVIFIARDHHNNNDEFINIKEGEFIDAKIIGKRFELNDSYISVIAELASKEIIV